MPRAPSRPHSSSHKLTILSLFLTVWKLVIYRCPSNTSVPGRSWLSESLLQLHGKGICISVSIKLVTNQSSPEIFPQDTSHTIWLLLVILTSHYFPASVTITNLPPTLAPTYQFLRILVMSRARIVSRWGRKMWRCGAWDHPLKWSSVPFAGNV